MTGETDIETDTAETELAKLLNPPLVELVRILNPSPVELVRIMIIERQKVSAALKDLYKKEKDTLDQTN